MRILIAAFTFAPQINGVAEVVGAHAEHFLRRGHDVAIATTYDPAREGKDLASARPAVFQFRISGIGNLRDPYRGEIEEYQEFVRHWDGDVIMCHCWQSWCVDLAVPTFKATAAKKVLVSHGFSAHWYPESVTFPRGFITWLSWRPHVWRAVSISGPASRLGTS